MILNYTPLYHTDLEIKRMTIVSKIKRVLQTSKTKQYNKLQDQILMLAVKYVFNKIYFYQPFFTSVHKPLLFFIVIDSKLLLSLFFFQKKRNE